MFRLSLHVIRFCENQPQPHVLLWEDKHRHTIFELSPIRTPQPFPCILWELHVTAVSRGTINGPG